MHELRTSLSCDSCVLNVCVCHERNLRRPQPRRFLFCRRIKIEKVSIISTDIETRFFEGEKSLRCEKFSVNNLLFTDGGSVCEVGYVNGKQMSCLLKKIMLLCLIASAYEPDYGFKKWCRYPIRGFKPAQVNYK